MEENYNEDILKQIQDEIESLRKEFGIEDMESQEDLNNSFGIDFGSLQDQLDVISKTKNIQIELLNEDAIFPEYAYPSDSGFDLYSTEEVKLTSFGRALVPTGLKLSFDIGYEIQVRPKSGLALKQGITVLNTPGTVDSGYNGEIMVIVFNTNQTEFTIPKGMKIAQAVLCPVVNGKYVNLQLVDKIEDKDRGDNGFGSTNFF
jgi:dUTP pyrophosphatase